MTIKALLVRGPLTDDEFAQVVDLLRDIDQEHDETDAFEIIALDDNAPIAEVERVMREALSPRPGRVTETRTIRRQ